MKCCRGRAREDVNGLRGVSLCPSAWRRQGEGLCGGIPALEGGNRGMERPGTAHFWTSGWVGHLAVTAPSGEIHSMSLSIQGTTEGCPSRHPQRSLPTAGGCKGRSNCSREAVKRDESDGAGQTTAGITQQLIQIEINYLPLNGTVFKALHRHY